MSPEDYQLFDWHRMFFGDLPLYFVVEIAIRTVIMYLYALTLIRLLGKRVAGQLSLVEFLVVIALGSAVGDPMFYPQVPLIHGFAVITSIVFIDRAVRYVINHWEKAETYVEGTPTLLVRNGRVAVDGLADTKMSLEALFEQLRLAGFEHLGQVREAYLEQGGDISTFGAAPEDVADGLRFVPPWDLVAPNRIMKGESPQASGPVACVCCGTIRRITSGQELGNCEYCDHDCWTDAVSSRANSQRLEKRDAMGEN